MIPEAAVEAAREAVGAIFGEPANSRDMAHVMAILEAAAPHMLAEARADALEDAANGWQTYIRAMNWGTTRPIGWLRERAEHIRSAK